MLKKSAPRRSAAEGRTSSAVKSESRIRISDPLLRDPEARLGSVEAQNNLGAFYATGRGMKKKLDEAEKWFLMAVRQGDAFAVGNLKRLQKEQKKS